MSAVCDICGKRPGFGKRVSHSDRAHGGPPRREQAAPERVHLMPEGRQGHSRLMATARGCVLLDVFGFLDSR
jgi:ribosomal protein L28